MKSNSHLSSKKHIAASFGAKVAGYNEYAIFQAHLLDRLLPTLLTSPEKTGRWLDAGCGNGILEHKLPPAVFEGSLIALDIAFQSLSFGKRHHYPATLWLCADLDTPPFKDGLFDGIITASVLQWSGNPGCSLTALSKVLKPGGHFLYAMFTNESFAELNEMRKRFNLPHPVQLPDRETIEVYLQNAHLCSATMESVASTMYFPSAWHLIKHLSAIGSTSVPSDRMSRTTLMRFCSEFEDTYRTAQGIPLTYAACFGSARKELTDV